MAQLQRYGPYGDKEAVENFSYKLEGSDRIKEVIVRAGFVVDAIGLTVASPNGDSDTSTFGGNGGLEFKVKLKIGEYITGISGKTKDSLISKLRIHTNLNKRGHGPYGNNELKGGCEFNSPPLSENDRFVGFFGTAHDNLVSIGLYVEKGCGCSNN
ncbi:protein GOS9-like [Chenopodium quinoa]|uniref:protein GOS9-like n=1 Tax=Chenopodium quinoa TaxID=63459 RepID=UPI000B783FCC|nr:protein GOS9-like [Chenopodium quinoa]